MRRKMDTASATQKDDPCTINGPRPCLVSFDGPGLRMANHPANART